MRAIKSIFGIVILSAFVSACAQNKVEAAPKLALDNAPIIQTNPPFIILNNNLDEKDKLGWCIDTKGRGFTEELHAHSCKPTNKDASFVFDDDVLFRYDKASGQIRSATYANKCAQILAEGAKVDFGLLDCDGQNSNQQFEYNADTFEFHPRGKGDDCIAVGEASAAAGPYMSRALALVSCESTTPALKQWTIVSDG